MSKQPPDDLFSDSTMSFGEHLEELRGVLVKAVTALAIGFLIGLFLANEVVQQIQDPLKKALGKYYLETASLELEAEMEKQGISPEKKKERRELFKKKTVAGESQRIPDVIYIDAEALLRKLQKAFPDLFSKRFVPPDSLKTLKVETWTEIDAQALLRKMQKDSPELFSKPFNPPDSLQTHEIQTRTKIDAQALLRKIQKDSPELFSKPFNPPDSLQTHEIQTPTKIDAQALLRKMRKDSPELFSKPFNPPDSLQTHEIQTRTKINAQALLRKMQKDSPELFSERFVPPDSLQTLKIETWTEIDEQALLRKLQKDSPELFSKPFNLPDSLKTYRIETRTKIDAQALLQKMHQEYPELFLKLFDPPDALQTFEVETWTEVNVRVQTLNAHEAFMIWIKAAFISGVVISSPVVFYYIWSFIAAGLYGHEKKYVHIYLPISLFLFIAGAALAFLFVFEPVLAFLFSFNRAMEIDPDPRISEWMSFVLFLPLGFGVAFQLPLIMLFLQRIGIIPVELFISKWRIAVLVIFVLSMFLTPADPISMLLLAVPLCLLYIMGIFLCKWMPRHRNPFDEGYDP